MGCTGSKSIETVGPEKNDNDDENRKSNTEERVQRQRRRLSVAPEQVGDVTKENNENSKSVVPDNVDNRFSTLSKDHLEMTDNHSNLYVGITKKGYVPYNSKKMNQDRHIMIYNFHKDEYHTAHLLGAADGHGELGHLVSQFIKENLPIYLKKYDFLSKPIKSLKRAVKNTSDALRKSKINTSFSGSTLVFSLIIDNTIYTANLGDSRAVLATKDENNENGVKFIDLSIDQKPNSPEEKQRILNSNGRVERLPGDNNDDETSDTMIHGPYRVWLKDVDIPGLAMSRSLGDDIAHSVGVSDIPIIMKHDIDPNNDLFIIWASDGVWEFITSQEGCNIVNKDYPNISTCAMSIVSESIKRWKREEDVIDDITAVIYNLQHKQQSIST